jgi:hypothetical protein
VTGPCRSRRRRNIRSENGAPVSLRELDIDITYGCEWDGGGNSLGDGGYEASGLELTAIHEGVDVALRQGFFQAVLEARWVTRSSLFLSEDRSSSENLSHLARISSITICLVSAADVALSRVEVRFKRHIGW